MRALIDDAWRLYAAADAVDDPVLVRPSIPLPYWGDGDAYVASPRKVVTIGLNPSRREFPADDPYSRFPAAAGLDAIPIDAWTDRERRDYLDALHAYFRVRPYVAWFDWFEHVLLGLDASFYDGVAASTAIHADFCSPLATDPTWSSLGRERERLLADGVPLWHRLIDLLAPDILLISIARRYRDLIAFSHPAAWTPVIEISRAHLGMHPYIVSIQWAVLPSGKRTMLVFGPAAQLPFATLTRVARREIGRGIAGVMDGG